MPPPRLLPPTAPRLLAAPISPPLHREASGDSEVVKGSTLRLDAAAETSDHARALQLLAAPIWLLLLIQSGCCCLPLGLPLLQLDARGLLLLFLANLLRSRRRVVGKPASHGGVVAGEPQCHPLQNSSSSLGDDALELERGAAAVPRRPARHRPSSSAGALGAPLHPHRRSPLCPVVDEPERRQIFT